MLIAEAILSATDSSAWSSRPSTRMFQGAFSRAKWAGRFLILPPGMVHLLGLLVHHRLSAPGTRPAGSLPGLCLPRWSYNGAYIPCCPCSFLGIYWDCIDQQGSQDLGQGRMLVDLGFKSTGQARFVDQGIWLCRFDKVIKSGRQFPSS